MLAACLSYGVEAVASHRTAGVLFRLIPANWRTIEVTTLHCNRRRPIPAVRVHTTDLLTERDVDVVDAIPVTSAPRTLIDLAPLLGASGAESAMGEAFRRGLVSLVTMERCLEELGRRRRPGVAVIRSILDDDGTMGLTESELEDRFLRLVKESGLPPPTCQHRVRLPDGSEARLDFAYPDKLVAIETDGFRWHSGRSKWERDLQRGNNLTVLGWRVLHLTWKDVIRRPKQTKARVSSFLARYVL